MNSPAFSAGRDLAFLKITDWPSKASYDQFKVYWYNTTTALNNAATPALNPSWTQAEIDRLWAEVKAQVQARDAALVQLRSALTAVRA